MDPFTISAGISAISSIFSGLSAFGQQRAEEKIHKANAQQDLQEAGVNSDIALRQGDEAAAKGAVAAAASGGGITGSAIDSINDLSQRAMFNARTQVYRGRTAANSELYQASVAGANATNALIGAAVGGGSSMLGGFAQDWQFKQQMAALGGLRGLGADSPYDYF